MHKHTRFSITAEHAGAETFVTAHAPAESPLSLAAEKAAQLHALLSMASDCAAAGTLERQLDDMQGRLLSLAAGLANETLVLSELAALNGPANDR
ncbi:MULTISPECIES: hypothetical protein [Cupriavidus]